MDAPQKFRVDCSCGDHILVSEGAAGMVFTCDCGKPIQVPSSIQLRASAGLKPIIPPEEEIEQLLLSGTIPGNETCSFCGNPTRSVILVHTECERAFKVGGATVFSSIGLFAVRMLLLPFRIWITETRVEQTHGKDKVYVLPLYLCEQCQPASKDPAALKRCMSKIPEYRELFDKFPNATVNGTRA